MPAGAELAAMRSMCMMYGMVWYGMVWYGRCLRRMTGGRSVDVDVQAQRFGRMTNDAVVVAAPSARSCPPFMRQCTRRG